MKSTYIYKRTEGGFELRADVFDSVPNAPVIVYLHSGGLIFGARDWLTAEQIDYWRSAGFCVVNLDYRLAPETKLADIVEDVRDGIRWAKEEASRFHRFDPNAMALVGSSAGGYLSLLAGTMPDVRPNAIVSLYGYGDILGDWLAKPSPHYSARPAVSEDEAAAVVGRRELAEGPWDRFAYYLRCRQRGDWLSRVSGLDAERDVARLIAYNPISRVSEDFPPTLFLHGDRDTDVPYEQSARMHEALRRSAVPTKLIAIDGADHVFDQHFREPAVQAAFAAAVDFLNVHL